MAKEAKGAAQESSSPVNDIVKDMEELLKQQFAMLRSEVREQLEKGKGAAFSLGSGAGALALGGILGLHAAVHGLHKATGLSLWACYALVGGLSAAAGYRLLDSGLKQAADLRLAPTKTAEAFKENVAFLGERVAAGLR